MRRLLTAAITTLALATAGAALATTMTKNKATDVKSTKSAMQSARVFLYAEPKAGKILEKLSPAAELVPIFYKGEWIKVGDPKNGHVGWINEKQYQKAREVYFRPNVQTVYINVQQDKQGKPTVNVVAYKNGKKLTAEQAKKLYQNIRKQQMQQYKNLQQMTKTFDQMIDQDFASTVPAFNSFPAMAPVIIVPEPAAMPELPPLEQPGMAAPVPQAEPN